MVSEVEGEAAAVSPAGVEEAVPPAEGAEAGDNGPAREGMDI
jgi:hypothetical protein